REDRYCGSRRAGLTVVDVGLEPRHCGCNSVVNQRPVASKETRHPYLDPRSQKFRLTGPPSGQGAGGGARTRDRRVPADLRGDSLAIVLPTLREDTPCRQRTNTACCSFRLWNCFNPPSPISPTRDILSQCSSSPSPISPIGDITSQCSSPLSPISPTRDNESQCSSPPSPISPTRDIEGQCPVRCRQYPPPGISKANVPVRHRQYSPPGI
ncbi:hypothetical protein PoB_007392000, partial [Plakobranchus ocellatus]